MTPVDPDQSTNTSSSESQMLDARRAIEATIAGGTSSRAILTQTSFTERRCLCLWTIGRETTSDNFDDTTDVLLKEDQITKAVAYSMIHDQPKRALEILRSRSQNPSYRQLALAIAGYMSGNLDVNWSETVHAIATDFTDVYATAMLALVSHGDWHDVRAKTDLPLIDRLSIALIYLDDDELTKYLSCLTRKAVSEGDLEGVTLTGLREPAVPLFENYIKRQFDIQTPTLAFAFSSPRYFTDPRVTSWRETYRSYLDDWQLFNQRASFDIYSTRLAASRSRELYSLSQSALISIRCTYCDQSLDHKTHTALKTTSKGAGLTERDRNILKDSRSGTSCPTCGRHMPRCVICMHWVGTPDPHSKGAVAQSSDRKAMERFINVCRSCWHVSHSDHAEEWFGRHSICPASDCECRCVEVDVAAG